MAMRVELNRKILEPQQTVAVASDAGDVVLKPLLGKNNLSVTDLSAVVDRLSLEVSESNESSRKTTVGSVFARVIALVAQSATVTRENMEALNRASELTMQLENVGRMIAEEQADLQALKQELAELQKSKVLIEASISETSARLDALKSMMEKTPDVERKKELEKEALKLENELASLNASLATASSSIDSKTVAISEKNARISALKLQKDVLVSGISDALSSIKDTSALLALAELFKSELSSVNQTEHRKKDDDVEEKNAQDVILEFLIEEIDREMDELVFNDIIESRQERNV